MNYMMQEREQDSRIPAQSEPAKKKQTSLLWGAVVCSVAALCVSIGALSVALPKAEPEPASEPEAAVEAYAPVDYITYKEHQLPVEDIPLSQWDPTGFRMGENSHISYESGGVSAVPGIDVSAHQKQIDWKKVADSGVRFAMIRMGYRGYGEEGKLMQDEYFHANMKGALEAGLDVGVYFFSQATTVWEAEEEAEMLLQELEGYNVSYPVVFDWERIHNNKARTDEVIGKTVSLMARAFCGRIEQAGYLPGVYFNQNLGYLSLELEQLDNCIFWLAEYDACPDFHYHADLWQYSSTGKVPGIEVPVDLNLSYRDFGAREG